MFACPLFHDFREIKNTKLKGTNVDVVSTTLIGVVCCVEIVWFEFAKIKGAKIIWHLKSSTFWSAKLKGLTVALQ